MPSNVLEKGDSIELANFVILFSLLIERLCILFIGSTLGNFFPANSVIGR